MPSLIQEKLKDKDWQGAVELLLAEPSFETSPKLIYNAIVCYINMKKISNAESLLKQYGSRIDSRMVSTLEKEIKKLQKKKQHKENKEDSKIVDGVIKNLGWFKSTTTFNEVIGLKDVKKEVQRKMIGPMKNPDVYKQYGASINGGVILYGPPGTGKTLLGRAIAGEIGGNMLIMKIPEILTKYQGDSEKNIRNVFEQARKNTPALIFIDELDALAQDRGNANELMGGTIKSIINTLLSEMDGIGKDNTGVFVLGTTNRPWDIDSAFKRDGRFGESIYVRAPNTKEREDIFKYYLNKVEYRGKVNYKKLGLLSFGCTPSNISGICNNSFNAKAASVVFDNKKPTALTTRDLLKEIKDKGDTGLRGWYIKTLEEMKKQPMDTINQYKDLKKDIIFWVQKSERMRRIYNLLALAT